MKNGKVPTRVQKILLKSHGLDPDKYLVLKDTPEQMEVVTRLDVTKRQISGTKPKIRTIYKEK